MTQAGMEGIGLTMLAGLMSGNCMLPAKFARVWRWENLWLFFSLISLLILPWALAFIEVHSLIAGYRSLPWTAFVLPLCLGAGWGIAQILFGISIRRLGLCLGYAIIVGLGAVLGTLVPLFFGAEQLPGHTAMLKILLGVVVMVIGIALTGWGGQLRELAKQATLPRDSITGSYLAAILLAVLCGLMAPMLNYAFAFGQGLALEAIRRGNSPTAAAYAVWPIALLGGFVPNLVYSLALLGHNRSWNIFLKQPAEVRWAAWMAVLWMGAFALYGVSSVLLGSLGTSVGWGLFQIFMIMTATLSGLLTAEWRGAPKRALALLSIGLMALIGATLLLSAGSKS
jgi:L-rhamnose-H+ transport protein